MHRYKVFLPSLCLLFHTLSAVQGVGGATPITFDYRKFDRSHVENTAWSLGDKAFNHAPELFPFFAKLKKDYQLEVAVETGTFRGSTTVAFSLLFNEVHTIEAVKATHLRAKKFLKNYPDVICHFGSSEVILNEILPNLQGKRTLFYLDAHWQEFWPLLPELEAISQTHKDNCVIVVDDVKVPQDPLIPYDSYGRHECSMEYMQEHLNLVFTDYTVYYLIPRNVQSRAKLVVIPKNWVKS